MSCLRRLASGVLLALAMSSLLARPQPPPRADISQAVEYATQPPPSMPNFGGADLERATGECEMPLSKDVECREAISALQDIKKQLADQHPEIYLDIEQTWEFDGIAHPLLDVSMFFDKSACTDKDDKDCMYEPRLQNSRFYWAVVDMQCSDVDKQKQGETARCKKVLGQDMNKHGVAREMMGKAYPGLAGAYRLMESVIMGMTRNGEVKHDIPLNCYTKLLFGSIDVPFKTKVSVMKANGKCELAEGADLFKMMILDPTKVFVVPGDEQAMQDFHTDDDMGGPGGRPAGPQGKPLPDPAKADTTGAAEYPGVAKLPLYLPRKRCEICTTVMMRKIATAPHLCSGLEFYFETCNDVLASILHWYPNVVYWTYTGGCDKMNKWGGTRRVRPCPPHAICSWLTSPNYNVPFCPWDGDYKAPGLEDNLEQDNGMDKPSDNLPPMGGNMGAPIAPMMGLIG